MGRLSPAQKQQYVETLHRMAEQNYQPTDAILLGMEVTREFFDAIWLQHHPVFVQPVPEEIAEEILTLAEEITGEEHARVDGALFVITQAALARGDAEVPDALVLRVEAVLEAARDHGLSGSDKAATALAAALAHIGHRASDIRAGIL